MKALRPEDLTPERALIFRITHRDNLGWALVHGLHCQASTRRDPKFIAIGNQELIGKRAERQIPVGPGGSLADYVPSTSLPGLPC